MGKVVGAELALAGLPVGEEGAHEGLEDDAVIGHEEMHRLVDDYELAQGLWDAK